MFVLSRSAYLKMCIEYAHQHVWSEYRVGNINTNRWWTFSKNLHLLIFIAGRVQKSQLQNLSVKGPWWIVFFQRLSFIPMLTRPPVYHIYLSFASLFSGQRSPLSNITCQRICRKTSFLSIANNVERDKCYVLLHLILSRDFRASNSKNPLFGSSLLCALFLPHLTCTYLLRACALDAHPTNSNTPACQTNVVGRSQWDIVDCRTRWSLWYWYLDVYVDHLYFSTQMTKKYSTAMF